MSETIDKTSILPAIDTAMSTMTLLSDLNMKSTFNQTIDLQKMDYGVSGRVSYQGSILEVESHPLLRTEVKASTYSKPGINYDAYVGSWGLRADHPRVTVVREDRSGVIGEHTFGKKYAKRAAELVVQLTSKRVAELGHERVRESFEQARIAQAAIARYERNPTKKTGNGYE
jgi:hypothetical protein